MLDMFQYKDHSARYRDTHYKVKTLMKPYHLYNENPYNGKATFLYLDAPCKPKLLDCIDKISYMPYESYQVGDVIFSHMILNPTSGYQVVCGR